MGSPRPHDFFNAVHDCRDRDGRSCEVVKALELMGTRIERAFLVCRDWSSSLAGAARIVHYVPLNEIHPGGLSPQRSL